MIRFFGSLKIFDFNSTLATLKLRESMRLLVEDAARAFIRAAVLKVPVDSGMARGSYLNIGRFLRVQIPISPKSPRSANSRKYLGTNVTKSPTVGAALSVTPEQAFQQQGGITVFNFNTRVFHYNLNEFFPLRSNRGVPWRSLDAGQLAFFEFLNANLLKRIPQFNQFLTTTTININRDGNITSNVTRPREQAIINR